MKTIKWTLRITAFLILISVFMVSCKKKKTGKIRQQEKALDQKESNAMHPCNSDVVKDSQPPCKCQKMQKDVAWACPLAHRVPLNC